MNESEVIDIEAEKAIGRYTYGAELAKRGIKRTSDKFMLAIDGAMIWLRKFRPFYGFVVDEMSVTRTYDVRTAAVSVQNGSICMFLNPDFFALLSMRHGAGVVAHECIHIICQHPTRYRKLMPMDVRRKRLVNIAMDLADNSLQSKPGDLPDFGLFPQQFRIPDKDKPREKWSQFPARTTFEEYMDLLSRLQDEDPGQLPTQPSGFTIVIGPGGEADVILDEHDDWGEVDAATAEIVEEIVRQRVKRAVDRARAAGIDPGTLGDAVTELLRTRAVNFSSLFSGMIGRFIANVRRPTMARPSKRYGMPPGRMMGRKLDLIWYQDTSGSMSDDEVQFGLSEARHAAESGLANVRVQQFDACLQGPLMDLKEWDVSMRVHGRGGTILRPVIEDIEKQQPDLAIISTDGGLEHHLLPVGVPVAFIVTHHAHVSNLWKTVIRLPEYDDIVASKKAA